MEDKKPPINLTEFFRGMAEMVAPFRSHTNLRDANLDGCRVLGAGEIYWAGDFKRPVKKGHFLFSFLAKGDHQIDVDIEMKSLVLKPEEYCHNLIEGINDALKEMQKESRLIIVKKRPLATAVVRLPTPKGK